MAKDRSSRPLATWGGAAPPQADTEAEVMDRPSKASRSAALRKWRKEEGIQGDGENNRDPKRVIPLTTHMRECLAFAHKQMTLLGPWEQKFVASLDQFVARNQGLTQAQFKKLQEVLSR